MFFTLFHLCEYFTFFVINEIFKVQDLSRGMFLLKAIIKCYAQIFIKQYLLLQIVTA